MCSVFLTLVKLACAQLLHHAAAPWPCPSSQPPCACAVPCLRCAVAFLQGMWPLGTAYMDTAVLQFMQATLDHYPYTQAQEEEAVQQHMPGVHALVARSRM